MERSPFAQIFNPDNPTGTPIGGMLGLIGQVGGVQTSQERSANAQAEAMQELNTLVQQGMTPQKAFSQFMTTPQGVEMFARGMTVDLAKNWMATISETPNVQFQQPGTSAVITRPNNPNVQIGQPSLTTDEATRRTVPRVDQISPGATPAITPAGGGPVQIGQQVPTEAQGTARTIKPSAVVGQGQTLLEQPGPGQSLTPSYSQPTTDAQNFEFMKRMANLPQEVVQSLAASKMLTDPMQQQQAQTKTFQDAVKRGSLTQQDADLLRSGAFGPQGMWRMIPVKNAFGDEIGHTIVNLGTNQSMFIGSKVGPDPRTTPGAPQPPQGSPAAATSDNQPTSANAPTLRKKSMMFFGAGVNPNILAPMGEILRGTLGVGVSIPGSEDAAADIRNLNALQTTLVNMSRAGAEGMGVPVRVIAAAENMGPKASMWKDPKTAVAHAIELSVLMTQEQQRDIELIRSGASQAEKKNADKRLTLYDNVLRALPPLDEMVTVQKDLAKLGPITMQESKGISDVVGGAVSGYKTMSNGTTPDGQQQQPPQGAQPQQQPKPSNSEQRKQSSRFQKMSPDDFNSVDPNKLSTPDLQLYQQNLQERLQQLRSRGKRSEAGGGTQMAGDVIDRSEEFSNLQRSNAITRMLSRGEQEKKPKAPVINPFRRV